MKTIIFVCHGSICRSPAAAFIAKKYLKEIGRDSEFNILIRATSSEEIGNDVYPPMRRELIRRGIPLYPHAAQRIRQSDYDKADYIFFMDDENYRKDTLYKMDLYRANGIYPGKNLLFTYETNDNPLDIKGIRRMLKETML